MVAKIKADLFGLPVDTFILKVRYIITTLATSVHFPNIPHPVLEIELDVNALEVLQNQVVAGNRINVGSRNALVITIRRKMAANATYINGKAMGNPAMLETSGYELSKAPAPHSVPPVISKISCKPVQPSGSVRVSWGGAKDRDYYVLEMRIGLEGSWVVVATTSKPNYTVQGLSFRQDAYFRVAAVNNAGISQWSNVAMAIVI